MTLATGTGAASTGSLSHGRAAWSLWINGAGYACGSTFLELSKKDFKKCSFLVPDLPEQERIAAVLNDADAEMHEHRQEIEKLRTEKKALMQKLLTGNRRVVVR
ncbi:restriction endonuclease subunit S [Thioclava sp. GXIMD4216]|uniref:restriction endonuclease subunit S n=1 Tax=Thioclava sp. GXIMD4216 TaxID=3131929 RepID=UPI0030D3E0D2